MTFAPAGRSSSDMISNELLVLCACSPKKRTHGVRWLLAGLVWLSMAIPKRKANYISRHKKRENWRDMGSAGFWAKNLLWNKPTLKASIRDVEKKFKVRITRK